MPDLLGLGLEPKDLSFVQMTCRALLAMPLALAFVRLGVRRSLARASAFDVLTGVVLGSVLSRAINGQAAYFPTLGVTAMLVAFHAVLAQVTARVHALSELSKGRPLQVLADGRPDLDALRRAGYTEEDLHEAMRLHGNVAEYADVEAAWLERSGEISIVKRSR